MRMKLITLIVLSAALAGAVLLSPASPRGNGGSRSNSVAQHNQHHRFTGGLQPPCRDASVRSLEIPGSVPYQ